MLDFDGIPRRDPFGFKDPEERLYCNSFVATAIVGSAVVGAGATIYASGKAADAQRDAANTANAGVEGRFQQTRTDLAPYRATGQAASDELQSRLPFLTSPIVIDRKTISDPNNVAGSAYNFTRTQGLKATQNSAVARGLGVSGAALKGAASFATGLADNTYKDLFAMENTNRGNAYDRLKGLVDVGENASAQTGVLGSAASKIESGNTIGAGNASAAAANATGGAIGNLANNIGGYAAYKGLYGSSPDWTPPAASSYAGANG